jgi:hypothetical protein
VIFVVIFVVIFAVFAIFLTALTDHDRLLIA